MYYINYKNILKNLHLCKYIQNNNCKNTKNSYVFIITFITFFMYKIKSPFIKENLIKSQNDVTETILRLSYFYDNIVVKAITGYGKTHVEFSILKSLILEGVSYGGILLTPTKRITIKFLTDNLLQESNNPSGISVAYMIGKGSGNPIMCPPYWEIKAKIEKYRKEIKEKDTKLLTEKQVKEQMMHESSVHKFCERYIKSCSQFHKMYDEINDEHSTKIVLKNHIKKEVYDFFLSINNPLNKDIDFYELVNNISNRLDVCPYYFLKEVAKLAKIIVCDYMYMIIPSYLYDIIENKRVKGSEEEIPTQNYSIAIDECDEYLNRVSGFYSTKIDKQYLEDSKLKLLDINPEGEIHKEFINYSIDIIDNFIVWIDKNNQRIIKDEGKESEISVNFVDELTTDKNLIDMWNNYEKISIENKYKIYFEDMMNKKEKNTFRRLLNFFENWDADIDYIEFISNDKWNNITFEREVVFYRKIFENMNERTNHLLLFSATPPSPEMLKLNIGNYKQINVGGVLGVRNGCIMKNQLFDFAWKLKLDDFNEKVKYLIEIIKVAPVKSIVIATKSNFYLKDESWDEITKQFAENNIKLFKCTPEDVEHENQIWEDYYKESKIEKCVMFVSSHSKWLRGVDTMGNDKCRLLLIWGIPIKRLPKKIIRNYMDKKLRQYGLTYKDLWYKIMPRNMFIQIIGRLVRGFDDYGYFIILSHDRMWGGINEILPKKIREKLRIKKIISPHEMQLSEIKQEFDEFFSKFSYDDSDIESNKEYKTHSNVINKCE